MSRAIRAALVAVAVTWLISPASAAPSTGAELAKEVKTDHRVTVHVPAGWVEAPRESVDLVMANVQKSAGGKVSVAFVCSYRQSDGPGWQFEPWFVVVAMKTGPMPEPELAHMRAFSKGMQSGVEEGARNNPGLSKVTIREPEYDPEVKMIWTELEMPLPTGGSFVTVMGNRLTNEGTVSFNGFCSSTELETARPLFRSMANAMVIDESLQYKGAPAAASQTRQLPRELVISRMLGQIAAALVSVALVAFGIKGLLRLFSGKRADGPSHIDGRSSGPPPPPPVA